MSDSDGESVASEKGYCHFNEDENNKEFTIEVFNQELKVLQHPGSRTLGHGAVVWDASVVFAKYMEYNSGDFSVAGMQSKTLLELGSGCGLGGLCLFLRGAAVCLTDLEAVTTTCTVPNAHNIYLKTVAAAGPVPLTRPIAFPIDWTIPTGGQIPLTISPISSSLTAMEGVGSSSMEADDVSVPQPPYDYVLLTDCVFSSVLVPDLVSTIRHCCGVHTVVYCCHEIRDEDANAAFLEEFGRYFKWKRIAKSKLHPQYQNNLIELVKAKPIRKHVLTGLSGRDDKDAS